MGGKKPSWSVRKASALRDSSKGEADEMTRERRDKLQQWIEAGDHDYSHLSRSETFLDTLKKKEAAERIKCDEPVEILFSSPLERMINRTTKRAVCVTKHAVHMLVILDNTNSISTARHKNHEVLCTFPISNLVSIIESKKDRSSVCLDFRPCNSQGKRKPIISSLTDATYILYPFPEVPPEKQKSISRKDEFVAVLYFRFTPPFTDDKPRGVLVYTDLALRTTDDAQRAISQTLRREALNKGEVAMVDLMDAAEEDKQQVAQNKHVVQLLKNEGDKRILVSQVVSVLGKSGSVKGAVLLILTDSAIYYNDIHQHDRLIRRVELQDIEMIVEEENPAWDPNKWDILLHIDLANDKSKDFSTDMLFRCESKVSRDKLIRRLESAYQDLMMETIDKLTATNIHRQKKGKLDAWLQTLRSKGGARRKQTIDERTEESVKWLMYLVQHKMYDFILALSRVIPQQKLVAMGKSLITLCGQADLTMKLIEEAVNVEMDSSTDGTTIFRGTTLSSVILCEYVVKADEEYAKLVLSAPLQAFIKQNPNIEVRRGLVDEREARQNAPNLWEWCDKFFDCITNAASVDSMPHEMGNVVGLISEACKKRSLDSNIYIGGYVMLRVFSPTITTPHTRGLNLKPDSKMIHKLMLIAKVLQHVSNKTFVSEATDPTFYHHVNWWLRKMCGSDAYVVPKSYVYKGAEKERTSWKVYINALADKNPSSSTLAGTAARSDTYNIAEIESRIREPGFADGYNARGGAALGLHSLLTMYIEQLVCLLWGETGEKKHDLTELEAKLEQLEQEKAARVSPSHTMSSVQFLSPPSFASPTTRAFVPRSPLQRKDFYARRSSMPVEVPTALDSPRNRPMVTSPAGRSNSPNQASSKVLNFNKRPSLSVNVLSASPRRHSRAVRSAFADESPVEECKPTTSIPCVGSNREALREKQDYVHYLQGLLSMRNRKIEDLTYVRDSLQRKLAKKKGTPLSAF
eukprot:TRINITY_DN21576_c0_g1_i1.p1 TRINITY_DN21576_c0_g1~~TRINITY_DN21576_c0_g1_i1.p1  ORF type:complete len:1023 (+),score=357.48 TRINITY_DN21576_c0_g1_i1:149-3070(+)